MPKCRKCASEAYKYRLCLWHLAEKWERLKATFEGKAV